MKKRNFVQWLQGELDHRDWNQADLARKSGISKAYISRIFSENREPSADTLKSIARALHLPIEIVYREAGLLPKKTEQNKLIEDLLFNLSHLTEDQQKQLLQYAKFMIYEKPDHDN